MVHIGAVRILAATNNGYQHRRTSKGSLADVLASHRYDFVDIYQLWLSSDESSQCNPLLDGCGGYFLPSKNLSLLKKKRFLRHFGKANPFIQFAKCLKYLGYNTLCDFAFGLFLVTWIAARHVFYMMICHSVWADIPRIINYGCYHGKNGDITGPFSPPDRFGHLFTPFRDPEGTVCWNDQIKWGFLSALLFLQCITLMWFWMIMKVAIKVIKGGEAEDIRSEDEAEDEEEDVSLDEKHITEAVQFEGEPYEEEVGVEALNLKGRTSRNSRYKKSSSSASGVSIPGHSDRKELLGRIGCDKGV
jgi:acyl-CoA-dependent ceramide synthase